MTLDRDEMIMVSLALKFRAQHFETIPGAERFVNEYTELYERWDAEMLDMKPLRPYEADDYDAMNGVSL